MSAVEVTVVRNVERVHEKTRRGRLVTAKQEVEIWFGLSPRSKAQLSEQRKIWKERWRRGTRVCIDNRNQFEGKFCFGLRLTSAAYDGDEFAIM
jgi:hypothetical protein